MYNLEWSRLIDWLLWSPIRKPSVQAWFHALLAPAKTLHGYFLLFQEQIREDVETNGQVTKMQAGLNRRFDPHFRRMLITDAPETDSVFIYTETENQPLYLPTFINGSNYDFLVYVPFDLMGEETGIRAFVDKYKLVTKRWELIWTP